ncbi:SDR family oxidoreductase [Geminocystis sp. NIES-3709]|uniref:SDR family NAD(P)-dependent oxidoreductase n=1 Tax=Geminocystis sp. NIES-3709 TaxID=1617448 RepID=UPI0005FC4ACE|nr:SDR family NAD(P)-dependent oxidoreductase [Geminocystis sp. NIES-3709]BAQ65898.1 short-chain dehydrogenase/reductase SDR [Geminocystis sp. NIES-3709]
MTKLDNTVILITGAGGGFGEEFIKQLLEKGSRLILTDVDRQKLLSQAITITSEINQGKIIACLQGDLSTAEGCQQLYEQVRELNISIDMLINNAGMGLYGRIDEVPMMEWQKLMQINLLSPMTLTALFLPEMIKQKKGHIVNISSLAGWVGLSGMSPYASSKFGLRGFSEALDREVKQYNIKVSVAYPFFSRTPILKSKAYGTLAENYQGFPAHLATNPADVIRQIIKGISNNKLHIFPDKFSLSIYLLKKYLPINIFKLLINNEVE